MFEASSPSYKVQVCSQVYVRVCKVIPKLANRFVNKTKTKPVIGSKLETLFWFCLQTGGTNFLIRENCMGMDRRSFLRSNFCV